MSVLFEISFENLSAPNSFLRLKCEMIGEKRKLKIGEKSTKKMMTLAPFCPSPIASYALAPTFPKMKNRQNSIMALSAIIFMMSLCLKCPSSCPKTATISSVLSFFISVSKSTTRFEDYEPLEYITGKAGFYGLEFEVESGVLIPRPETEILVDKVLEIASSYKAPKIAEIGTGSGIISVMLALKTNAKIVATDINEKALKLAKKNALKFNVSEKIDFVKCSYIDEISGDIDILVSNPPYMLSALPMKLIILGCV